MPVVTEYSQPGAVARYANCARVMGLASSSDDDIVAGRQLLDGLYQLNEDLRVPSPKAFGINENDYWSVLDSMAGQALASGSPGNNPVIPKEKEIKEALGM